MIINHFILRSAILDQNTEINQEWQITIIQDIGLGRYYYKKFLGNRYVAKVSTL